MRFLTGAGVFATLMGTVVTADALETSARPVQRPTQATATLALVSAETTASPRPESRPAATATAALQQATPEATDIDPRDFDAWLRDFRARAAAQGIRDDVMDRAFAGLTVDPQVVKLDRNQSEYTKAIWDYLDSAASTTRVANGRAALARYGDTLKRIEAHYGVDRRVVVGIWGL